MARKPHPRITAAELARHEAEVAAYIEQQLAARAVWRLADWPLVGELRWRRVMAVERLGGDRAMVRYEECVGLR